MNPTLCVSLELNPYEKPKRVCINLKETRLLEAFSKIDKPSTDAGIERIFCDTNKRIREVENKRQQAAEYIAAEMTQAIIKLMADNDTVMGYNKDDK